MTNFIHVTNYANEPCDVWAKATRWRGKNVDAVVIVVVSGQLEVEEDIRGEPGSVWEDRFTVHDELPDDILALAMANALCPDT